MNRSANSQKNITIEPQADNYSPSENVVSPSKVPQKAAPRVGPGILCSSCDFVVKAMANAHMNMQKQVVNNSAPPRKVTVQTQPVQKQSAPRTNLLFLFNSLAPSTKQGGQPVKRVLPNPQQAQVLLMTPFVMLQGSCKESRA